jgi:hypothetical protein
LQPRSLSNAVLKSLEFSRPKFEVGENALWKRVCENFQIVGGQSEPAIKLIIKLVFVNFKFQWKMGYFGDRHYDNFKVILD